MTLEISFATILGAAAIIWGAYQGVCWILDRYNVGKRRKESKLLRDANRNMMRELIRASHHEFLGKGYIREDELEHIEKINETYHQLGGNGTAARWMTELRNLPREKED